MVCFLPAQTPIESIEIEGVTVRTGISVSEALLLFKGKEIIRNENTIDIIGQVKVGTQTFAQVRGRLILERERLSGACKPWNYSGSEDSELARVLFAALNGSAQTLFREPALITTSVDRGVNQTVETVTIRIGRRTIKMTRQAFHVKDGPMFAEVEECLWP